MKVILRKMIRYGLIALALLVILSLIPFGGYAAANTLPNPSAITLSQDLLTVQKEGQSPETIVQALAILDARELKAELDTREKQLSFWVNIYNGMVQYLLEKEPAFWERRNNFFSTRRFTIAGQFLSLEDVEHGIIRGGEAKLGLGHIPKLFQNKFERTFKIKKGDPRVHFALNCGAIDCPPVEIYDPATVNERFDHRSRVYLKKHTTIAEDGKSLTTTPLFSWFRGDFGTYGGISDFLVHFGILTEENKNIKRKYKNYDWTLATNVWAED
ncbi:MAG: DUF547 domain-containing protein [Bacteroidota bacterium]